MDRWRLPKSFPVALVLAAGCDSGLSEPQPTASSSLRRSEPGVIAASGCGLYTDFVPNSSVEALFLGADRSLALFDARRIPAAGSAAGALAEPIAVRTIGAGYNPDWAEQYFINLRLPDDFDLLVFVKSATQTILLPVNF
jgi:hypothetical protein